MQQAGTNLDEVLQRTAHQLAKAAELAARIDVMVGKIPIGNKTDIKPHYLELQEVDVLRQTIEDLSRFLSIISREIPFGLQTNIDDAVSRLTLSDLAQYLAGHPVCSAPTEPSGDVRYY